MKSILWVLFFFLLIFGIVQSDSLKEKMFSKSKDSTELSQNSNLQESAVAVVNFLTWYKLNYDEISKIETINNFTGEYDSTKFYSVNFTGTENYLKKLKSSGYISEKYISTWRKYFLKCEQNFKQNPQNDGPPNGFEFDFVLWTQEIDETLESINNYKILNVNESEKNSVVDIEITMNLEFTLSKINGKWLIDNIENK